MPVRLGSRWRARSASWRIVRSRGVSAGLTKKAKVILLDAAPAVLGAFGDKLSNAARQQLESIGVDVELNAKVVGVDNTGVDIIDADGNERRIRCRKVWAAGVSASPLGKQLAEQSGAEIDRAGRVKGTLI